MNRSNANLTRQTVRRCFVAGFAWLLFLAVPLPQGHGQSGRMADSSDRVSITGRAESTEVLPGADVALAVVLDHDENWHTHTQDPQVPPELGDSSLYIKTRIEPGEPTSKGLRVHDSFIQWPEAQTIEVAFAGEAVSYDVFGGKSVAYVPVSVSPDAEPGPAMLTLNTTYQACDDSYCLAPVYDQPIEFELTILPPDSEVRGVASEDEGDDLFAGFDPAVWSRVHEGEAAPGVVTFDLFGSAFDVGAGTWWGLGALLLVSALGGALLNLTPCVLPVIPIKVMGLSQAAGNPGRCFALGLSMSLGVVAFWLALGGVMAAVAGFTAVNQLFQQPLFTIGVGLFIAAMAVGMCGLFSVRVPQFVYRINPRHDTHGGSFVFGIMTAILSTPCTAPFMGAALGWSITQSPIVSLAVFGSIGAGMAMPYLILSSRPRLVAKVPRTGPASVLVKQVMGLLMLAAAAYFIGIGINTLMAVDGQSAGQSYWWGVAFFVMAAGGWLAWRTFRLTGPAGRRLAFGGVGLAMVAAALLGGFRLTASGPIDWVYYTPERFEQATAQGRPVLMDFTADWCLNCKALEESVLRDPEIAGRLGTGEVVPMKVDLTSSRNTAGKEMLARMERATIPLLVIFGPDGQPRFKSDFYTVNQVATALDEVTRQP